MYQADAAHTGYTPVSLNPDNFSVGWSRQMTDTYGGHGIKPVVVANGRVFVAGFMFGKPDFLQAVSATTGKKQWRVDLDTQGGINPPSASKGRVYLQALAWGSGGASLRAFDQKSGAVQFQSPYPAMQEQYLAPTIYKNTVYLNGEWFGIGLFSFNKDTGQQNWWAVVPTGDNWTPAVDASRTYVYLNKALHVHDRISGALAYTVPDPNSTNLASFNLRQAPVLGGMNDVYVTNSGRLLRFDTARQSLVWEKADHQYQGQVSVANGVVYAMTDSGVVARSQVGGDSLWVWSSPAGAPAYNMVITLGHLFVSTATTTYCVDLASHQTVWSASVAGPLAMGSDHLYVAGAGGLLTAFRLTAPAP